MLPSRRRFGSLSRFLLFFKVADLLCPASSMGSAVIRRGPAFNFELGIFLLLAMTVRYLLVLSRMPRAWPPHRSSLLRGTGLMLLCHSAVSHGVVFTPVSVVKQIVFPVDCGGMLMFQLIPSGIIARIILSSSVIVGVNREGKACLVFAQCS
jgi:hypothetical protein